MSVTTTVGNTTLTRTANTVVDSASVRRIARDAREIKRAMACLTRETQHWKYLRQQLLYARQQVKTACSVSTHFEMAYQGKRSTVLPGNLRKAWLALRDSIRAEVRERRRSMREDRARYWYGFDAPMNTRLRANQLLVTEERYHTQGTASTVCGVNMTANTYRHAYVRKLRRTLLNNKAPMDTDTRRWVSVEIECVLGTSSDALCDEVITNGAAKWLCVKSDGSLRRNDGDLTGTCVEIVISAPATEIEQAVTMTCEALAKCKAYVNKTCGLHVHFDMRHFDRSTAFSNLVAGQRVLRLLVPTHRVKNRFCKPVGRRDWPVNDDRYKAVNHCAWRRHRTIEVRLFAGCVEATKIMGYIKVCSAMAYANNVVKRAPSSLTGWQKANPEAIDNNLMLWVKEEARVIAALNEAELAATANNNQAQLPL